MRGLPIGPVVVALLIAAGSALAFQEPGGPEVMARGPLHEAFAAPVVYNPTPGVVVPKAPPGPVEEQPPDQKPQGRDVEWIPGYWAWDDERADFLWISGIWRDLPPGRQWVPGYWSPAEGGSRWTPGFWSPVAANGQVSYLPVPPRSLEIGPNAPQPGPECLWMPGSWAWAEDRYLWRPGYWFQSQPSWVWVPPSYVPTPAGYVFVDGFWDFPIERRGVIFAPVVFQPAVILQPAYVYTPSVVLSIGGLTANLFIRPSCHQYYFGDYYAYAAEGPRSGYVAWFSYQQQRIGYDPIYASMAMRHRDEPEWDRRVRSEYTYRVEHREARPAPTFLAQREQVERRRERGEDVRGLETAHPLGHPGPGAESARRLEPVRETHRADLGARQENVRRVQQDRARLESAAPHSAHAHAEPHPPHHMEIPHSTIAARPAPTRGHAEPLHHAPPAHPDGHEAFRPSFALQPHREPIAHPSTMPRHAEPQARPAAEHHAEPRPKPTEHHKPGKEH